MNNFIVHISFRTAMIYDIQIANNKEVSSEQKY